MACVYDTVYMCICILYKLPGGIPPNGVFSGSRGLLRLGYMRFVNQLNRFDSSTAAELLLYDSAFGRILYVIFLGSEFGSGNGLTKTMPAK